MPGPELVFERVTAGYGGPPAVEEVDLSVRSGEVVGLVGPNGSGKTTLVRVASRALRPVEGLVRVGGRDPFSIAGKHAARLVAVVPQEVAPTFSFTALEVVLMGRSPYLSPWGSGDATHYARVREAMATVLVSHLAERTLEELSGGEKQRVILAQALAQDAPVLLLDEPTTHLDVRHVVGILDTVRRLARDEGKAVLAIFHDLNLASAYCDRVVALRAGRVVSDGPPEEVVTPWLLHDVYGVSADVHPHPVTGRPTVVLGPPIEPPVAAPWRPRAHVVGGAGRGAPAMRILAQLGYEVTAGVLHATDTDAIVAERLNLARITVPPFSDIDDSVAAEAEAMMRGATLVVVCDAPYGPGNLRNLETVVRAAEAGARVVLLDQVPVAERDFTGGAASRLWERLASRAEVIRSYAEVSALAGPAMPRSGGEG